VDDSLKWERYSALGGGILFIVLVVASILIPGSTPMASDSPTKILNYFRDHKDSIELAAFIGGLAAVPILWWAGSLWARLRRAEGGQPRLALVAVLGLVLGGAGQVVSGAVLSTVALRLDAVGPNSARFFFVLGTGAAAAGSVGLAVMVLATSVLVFRTGVFPRWVGWLGAIDAIAFLVASYSVASTSDTIAAFGFASFILWAIWILTLSIIMFRGHEATSPSAAPVRAPEPQPVAGG
jgi:hypothetical protein